MLIALMLGTTSILAFAPFHLFPMIWLTQAALFALLGNLADRGASWQRASLIGGAFGFGFFLVGTSWIYVSLSTFGDMPSPVAGLATVLFCAFLAGYPALLSMLFVRYAPDGRFPRTLMLAALWTLSEWLRGWIFTGFPWLTTGYAHLPPSPLAGFSPVIGVYGVSLVSTLVSSLVCLTGQVVLKGYRRVAIIPPLVILMILGVGTLLREIHWTTAPGDSVRVSLLQGNIAQDLKWRPEAFGESLRTYYRLAAENPAPLMILPETALPAFLHEIPRAYLDELRDLAAHAGGDMIFGVVSGDYDRYANSAVSLGTSGTSRYDKSHLVPFGEFIPSGFAWFMAMARIPMSSFSAGAERQAPMPIGAHKIAVNICYEDAFGEEIIRSLPEATLLVNLSNIAWFGDSLAPAQHLQISQMRALETGRMMLRATNTGITAIIDADGTLVDALKPFTRAVLRGEVRSYTGSTPYVRWGNVPALILAFILLVVALTAFPHKRKPLS